MNLQTLLLLEATSNSREILEQGEELLERRQQTARNKEIVFLAHEALAEMRSEEVNEEAAEAVYKALSRLERQVKNVALRTLDDLDHKRLRQECLEWLPVLKAAWLPASLRAFYHQVAREAPAVSWRQRRDWLAQLRKMPEEERNLLAGEWEQAVLAVEASFSPLDHRIDDFLKRHKQTLALLALPKRSRRKLLRVYCALDEMLPELERDAAELTDTGAVPAQFPRTCKEIRAFLEKHRLLAWQAKYLYWMLEEDGRVAVKDSVHWERGLWLAPGTLASAPKVKFFHGQEPKHSGMWWWNVSPMLRGVFKRKPLPEKRAVLEAIRAGRLAELERSAIEAQGIFKTEVKARWKTRERGNTATRISVPVASDDACVPEEALSGRSETLFQPPPEASVGTSRTWRLLPPPVVKKMPPPAETPMPESPEVLPSPEKEKADEKLRFRERAIFVILCVLLPGSQGFYCGMPYQALALVLLDLVPGCIFFVGVWSCCQGLLRKKYPKRTFEATRWDWMARLLLLLGLVTWLTLCTALVSVIWNGESR